MTDIYFIVVVVLFIVPEHNWYSFIAPAGRYSFAGLLLVNIVIYCPPHYRGGTRLNKPQLFSYWPACYTCLLRISNWEWADRKTTQSRTPGLPVHLLVGILIQLSPALLVGLRLWTSGERSVTFMRPWYQFPRACRFWAVFFAFLNQDPIIIIAGIIFLITQHYKLFKTNVRRLILKAFLKWVKINSTNYFSSTILIIWYVNCICPLFQDEETTISVSLSAPTNRSAWTIWTYKINTCNLLLPYAFK